MNQCKSTKGHISPYQLFFIFLVSRAVVSLTFYQSILESGITPDILLSSALALLFNLLLCLPAYFCVKLGKNPLSFKLGRAVYFLYFVFFASVNISRFAFFASAKTFEGANALFFILLISAAAGYAASLNIEALARFSVICAVLSIIVLILITALNMKNFQLLNFMPFFVSSENAIIKNALIFSSNSVEPALFLILCNKCKESSAKPLFFGIIASYFAIFLMLVFCIGVMGSAAPLFPFPVYTLFQMTSFKNFSRIDIVYTAFGFFALFAKCALLIYCADESIKNLNFKAKYPVFFAFFSVLSFVIYKRYFESIIISSRDFYFALSIIFSAVIPLIFLFFKKEDKNEKAD